MLVNVHLTVDNAGCRTYSFITVDQFVFTLLVGGVNGFHSDAFRILNEYFGVFFLKEIIVSKGT